MLEFVFISLEYLVKLYVKCVQHASLDAILQALHQ